MCRQPYPRRSSRPEGEAPQDAVTVEHGGDALFDDHGDIPPRVRPADGALEAAELDVAPPVEARGADLAAGMSSREYDGRKRGRQPRASMVSGTRGPGIRTKPCILQVHRGNNN